MTVSPPDLIITRCTALVYDDLRKITEALDAGAAAVAVVTVSKGLFAKGSNARRWTSEWQ